MPTLAFSAFPNRLPMLFSPFYRLCTVYSFFECLYSVSSVYRVIFKPPFHLIAVLIKFLKAALNVDTNVVIAEITDIKQKKDTHEWRNFVFISLQAKFTNQSNNI